MTAMRQLPLFEPDPVPAEIAGLIARRALFVVNHSGGKDSQAMLLYVRRLVGDDNILIVHADLPEVDWPDIETHIRDTSDGLPLSVCRAGKTFFEMVERRGMFPSPKYRQCTSDLKRGPIERTIREISRRTGRSLIVNCMGMRAEESSSRAKLTTLQFDAANSKAGRLWYEWLPIHHLTEAEVFDAIAAAGQKPHWAYAAGMSRLSCCFCIMANRSDLTTAARLQPELYRRYVETERRLDQTMMMPAGGVRRFLPEITGVAP
jgi:DNA sulfur modification protein DndC